MAVLPHLSPPVAGPYGGLVRSLQSIGIEALKMAGSWVPVTALAQAPAGANGPLAVPGPQSLHALGVTHWRHAALGEQRLPAPGSVLPPLAAPRTAPLVPTTPLPL